MPNRDQELARVVAQACAGATVLTANVRASRFLLACCDRELRANAQTWRTPDILPFRTWIERVWTSAQAAGSTSRVLLNSAQRADIWNQILASRSSDSELLQPSSVASAAISAWELLHQYGIKLSPSVFGQTRQSKEFFNWASEYQKRCQRENWIDSATVSAALAELVPSIRTLLPDEMIFWRCGEFTPQEARLVAELSASNIAITQLNHSEADWSSAVRLELDDPTAELSTSAAWARAQLLQGSDRCIGVVVPQLGAVRDTVERIFTEVLAPEFYVGEHGSSPFELSEGVPLGSAGLARSALLWIRFLVEPLSFCELQELIRAPYLMGETAERSSRALLATQLGGVVPDRVDLPLLLRVLDGRRDSRPKLESCPTLRRMLNVLEDAKRKWPARAHISEWADRFSRLLRDLGWPKGDDRKLDSYEFQASDRWGDMLAKLSTLDVTRPAADLRNAVSELTRAANATTFSPENVGAPVQVITVEELQGSFFDALWMCGLSDDAFPARRRANPYIPITVQRKAGVPGSTPEDLLRQSQETLESVIDSARTVVFSSPAVEGDRPLRQSALIAIARGVNRSEISTDAPASWAALQHGALVELASDVQAPKLNVETARRRGTDILKHQSNCPFRAFAELRLGAGDRDEPSPGFKGVDRGRVIERILELLWNELREQSVLLNSTNPIQPIVERAVETAMQEKLPDVRDDAASARLRTLERERLVALTLEWLDKEKQRAPFRVEAHQQKITFTLGDLELKGQIDRIDRIDSEGLVIIDYKAGAAANYKPGKWKVPRPELPQLPFYAAALASGGQEIAGVSFAVLARGSCELQGISTRKEILARKTDTTRRYTDNRSVAEQVTVWRDELARLAAAYANGDASADPKVRPGMSNSTCDRCHLHALCHIGEVALVTDEETSDE